jgi:hypothetical protein
MRNTTAAAIVMAARWRIAGPRAARALPFLSLIYGMLASKQLLLALCVGSIGADAYTFQAAGALTSSLLSKSTRPLNALRPAAGFSPKLGPQRPMGLRGGFRMAYLESLSPTVIKTEKLTPQTAGLSLFSKRSSVPLCSNSLDCFVFELAEKLLLSTVDVFIFDCDGVIWKGDSLIPGIPNVIAKLRAAGKKIFFVTNNSTKSRKGYKAKFDELGLSVNPEEIFSSSFAAAAYFEKTNFRATGKKVYIIGERGIQEELDLVGVPWFVFPHIQM